MIVIWVTAGVLLIGAASLTMYRMLSGPSTLDRLVAMDTIVAVTLCALGTYAAFSLDSTIVPSIVALSLIGFVGSISVARFRVRDHNNTASFRRTR
ncbi:MAG: monovalent cation/H+ antiporter complex subunit F [Mycobacteriaceae bacterium]